MVNFNVRFTEDPDPIIVSPLPDGRCDIWIRHGIGNETKIDENGNAYVEYYAEREAYARLDEPFTMALNDINDDAIFERIAAWEPSEAKRDKLQSLSTMVDKLAAKIDALLTYQGLTVREIGSGAYEVAKRQPASGDYLNPIPYTAGDAVTAGLWYYTTDKSLPHEAILTGVPGSFRDKVYFDFVD